METLIELKQYYQEILALMKPEFTSHQFILALAQAHQPEYVRALFAYVDVSDGAVFRTLHGQIARSLHEYAKWIDDVPSTHIFGDQSSSALWQKHTDV